MLHFLKELCERVDKNKYGMMEVRVYAANWICRCSLCLVSSYQTTKRLMSFALFFECTRTVYYSVSYRIKSG